MKAKNFYEAPTLSDLEIHKFPIVHGTSNFDVLDDFNGDTGLPKIKSTP